ncbi:OmpA family protein [Acetobacter musti]|uniref:OmpA family protein n=1 Tax=Acetobacter musti TaxID=864732 RepID=A0ABX0JRF0_9PROT|nr:OmpA family protein [Acetobacter musti]NHN85392.1 OmpA family protein [Acetobacter musti]
MRRLLPAVGLCFLAGCATGPGRQYVVFFGSGSTALDDSARNVVSEAASWSAKRPGMTVEVEGYARSGKDLSADELLAIDRAKVVAQELIADGVPANRIVQKPRPPSNADGVVGSRRVEIELVSP